YSNYLYKTLNFHDIDTEYSRIQIYDTTDEKSGRKKRVMKTDPQYYQSSMYLDNGEPASEYHKFYHLIKYYNPDFQRVLMIGGAGYSFPKEYLKTYPNAEIDVVEIDPQMTDIAKKYFRLKENPRLKNFHEDGRVFLNQARDNHYDAVLIDAFTTLFSIPFQLTTIEAVRQINRTLKDNGVVIVNIGGALEGKSSGFLRAELNTYKQIFPKIQLIKVNPKKNDAEIQNWIMIASQRINFGKNNDAEIENLLNQIYQKQINLSQTILTDDLAPVEYFNSFAN
ncbi:MAG: spermidine synthase, partial [Aridibacter sp.]